MCVLSECVGVCVESGCVCVSVHCAVLLVLITATVIVRGPVKRTEARTMFQDQLVPPKARYIVAETKPARPDVSA